MSLTPLNLLTNRVTALDGITSPVPSAAAVPTIEADLNGIHTTISQVTLTLQAQLNQLMQEVAVLTALTNQLLGGAPLVIPVTKRLSYTIQPADVLASSVNLSLIWTIPYVDLNYTCSVSVESALNQIGNYYVNAFIKYQDHIVVNIGVGGLAGDVIVVDALAMHD